MHFKFSYTYMPFDFVLIIIYKKSMYEQKKDMFKNEIPMEQSIWILY